MEVFVFGELTAKTSGRQNFYDLPKIVQLLDKCQGRLRNFPMKKPRHPKKPIEFAIQEAETRGWRVVIANGYSHPWCRLHFPLPERTGHHISVSSNPRVPEDQASKIYRAIKNCEH